ncbi:MAG TPA: hypothetical protein VJP59_02195 [Gemmatimonadota bacterium]|nr:hypothetical protein [Gemmatimonadota bacterium]
MFRFVSFTALVILLPVLGCNGESGENGPTDGELADSVSQWIHAGEATAVTNGEACLYVTAEGADQSLFGDSIRVAIAPAPAELDTLPPTEELPPAFQAAVAQGRKVFPPLYRFYAYDATGQSFTEFSPTGEAVVVVAMCVTGRPGDEEAVERALIARPDPANPENLQYFEPEEPPAECRLTCELEGSQEAAREAARPLERWLTGTALTATPAFAAQCGTCFKSGIGGGGAGNSPFAAVDSVVAADDVPVD